MRHSGRDEDDAVARELAPQRHRLIGIAEVVADTQLDLLAAARGPLAFRSSTAIAAPRW